MTLDAVPIMMVRNEEFWVQAALRPLLAVFDRVLVADTGSTDGTVDLIRECVGAERIVLHELGEQTPAGLTGVRQFLTDEARRLGYAYTFLVDGDEVYAVEALRHIVAEGCAVRFGLARMMPIDRDAAGDYWEIGGDLYWRVAVQPTTTTWKRAYPKETPNGWPPKDGSLVRWGLPAGYRYHVVHAHRCRRSPDDAAVYLRTERRPLLRERGGEKTPTRAFDLADWTQR